MGLVVNKNLPLGIAWSWVKFSFAVFREKPINFIAFSLAFIIFSAFPFIGSFLGILVLVRIYLSADKVANNLPFGLQLQLKEILQQRNIINYALLNLFFDCLNLLLLRNILALGHLSLDDPNLILNHYVLFNLCGLSLLRMGFFGISLVILTFNPQLKLVDALLLSWKFIFYNSIVLIFGLFLLLPFVIIPIYILLMLAVNSTNPIFFTIFSVSGLVVVLLFIAVSNIFLVKLYADGIKVEI
jgi:hypothetical protein